MDLLIVYESSTGTAGRVAFAIAAAARSRDVAAAVHRIDDVAPADVAVADAVVVGCWMPGKVPFGDPPAHRLLEWIDRLPALHGKPAALYCAYRSFPRTFADTTARTAETESALARGLAAKGATVVATRSIGRRSIDEGASVLVEELLQGVTAG